MSRVLRAGDRVLVPMEVVDLDGDEISVKIPRGKRRPMRLTKEDVIVSSALRWPGSAERRWRDASPATKKRLEEHARAKEAAA